MGELVINNLVIGMGEVGKAIYEILHESYGEHEVAAADKNSELGTTKFNFLHICFPPSDKFIEYVEEYKKKYLADGGLVIVHSSVAIGTCEKLNACHSPIRGLHPNLYSGIKTFVKYFAGHKAYDCAKVFEGCGIKTRVFERARDTEGGKLADTSQFGIDIIKMKLVKTFCEENDLNFEIVWTDFNRTYNDGYVKLGKPQFIRPSFDYVPGKIGGHCILQNTELMSHELALFIKQFNEKL